MWIADSTVGAVIAPVLGRGADGPVELAGVSFRWLCRKVRGAPPLPVAGNYGVLHLAAMVRARVEGVVIDRALGV